jgi:hypothetical protein
MAKDITSYFDENIVAYFKTMMAPSQECSGEMAPSRPSLSHVSGGVEPHSVHGSPSWSSMSLVSGGVGFVERACGDDAEGPRQLHRGGRHHLLQAVQPRRKNPRWASTAGSANSRLCLGGACASRGSHWDAC